jgi:multiple sugar transport system substrate-binding protein
MKSKIWKFLAVMIVFTMLLAGCAPATQAPATQAPATQAPATQAPATTKAPAGPVKLTMWYHGAGNVAERAIIHDVVADFNASQGKYVVELQDLPQTSYNDSVTGAAVAGTLPDILDVDAPIMPNWAWAGFMAPLELKPGALDNWLPSTIGYWNGKVYSVGMWEAACAFFARKSVLEKYKIRIPTLDKPWTLDEFNGILATLKASGEFAYPLDLGMAWTGEWYPYGFSPFLQSFGGDIVNRSTFTTAEGALNGPEAIAFGKWWQSLFKNKYVSGTTQDGADRDTGFLDGKYAMMWNGNWAASTASDKLGNDLLLLPAPNFGNGSRIGAGSWQFGVSAISKNKAGANEFIQFMMQDKYLIRFSDEWGNFPPTKTAVAASKRYRPGAPFEAFFALSTAQATLRPPTPAYLAAAKIFEKAMADISNGADVTATLDAATDQINTDIKNNNGYGFDGSVKGPSIKEDAIAKNQKK